VDLIAQGVQLSNINGVFPSVGAIPGGSVIDFFSLLGEGGIDSLKGALAGCASNGLDAPNNELQVTLNSANFIKVIGVNSWIDEPIVDSLLFDLDIVGEPVEEVELAQEDVDIHLNVDNINLIRESVDPETENPPAGGHYSDNPEAFTVQGTNRPYNEIIEIYVENAQNGYIGAGNLPSGGGPDWLQVAAADIYNGGGEVFSAVWKIKVADLGAVSSDVFPSIPYEVCLNPYIPQMRFNQPSTTHDLFHADEWRYTAIQHAALRCYQLLPRQAVNDEENSSQKINDELFVNGGDAEPGTHLNFSYDNKEERGFLKPKFNFTLGDWAIMFVDAYINGESGDNYFNNSHSGHFILRIDDQLTDQQLQQLFLSQEETTVDLEPNIDFGLPEDLPLGGIGVPYLRIFIKVYIKDYSLDFYTGFFLTPQLIPETLDFPNLSLGPPYQETQETAHGYYLSGYYELDAIESLNNIFKETEGKAYYYLLKAGMAELYVLADFNYKHDPYGYDCSYFAISN